MDEISKGIKKIPLFSTSVNNNYRNIQMFVSEQINILDNICISLYFAFYF